MTPERFEELMRGVIDQRLPADTMPLDVCGLDDLDLVDIVCSIEREDKRTIADSTLLDMRTFGDLRRIATQPAERAT